MTKHDIVCLPGLLCTPALWEPALTAAGLSGSCLALADSDRLDDLAEDVLARAPDRFILAGFSLGGYVALRICQQAPDRVAGLLLVSTSARADTDEQRQARRSAITKAREVGLGAFAELTADFLLSRAGRIQPEFRRTLVRMAEDFQFQTFANHQLAAASRVSTTDRLADFNLPAVVVVGDADRITPPMLSQELAEGISRSQLQSIPDVGHQALLEAPDHIGLALRKLVSALAERDPN